MSVGPTTAITPHPRSRCGARKAVDGDQGFEVATHRSMGGGWKLAVWEGGPARPLPPADPPPAVRQRRHGGLPQPLRLLRAVGPSPPARPLAELPTALLLPSHHVGPKTN